MTTENENQDIVNDELDEASLEDDGILDLFDDDLEDDPEDDENDDLDPQDGDTLEVLKVKLTARNKIIRQREAAIKRMQSELDQKGGSNQLGKEELAELITLAKGKEESQEEDGPSIESLKERFEEDPSTVIDLILSQNQQLETKLANVLQQRDAYFEGKMKESSVTEAPADIKALAQKLKARPEYAGFDDNQLITVARSLKPLGTRVKRAPASTSSSSLPITATNEQVEKVSKSALEQMGYTDED